MKQGNLISIFKAYLLWVAAILIHSSWILFTSEFKNVVEGDSFPKFIAIFYAGVLLMLSIGAILAWFSQLGKKWALWLFTLYSLYMSISALWNVKTRAALEHSPVDVTDWIIGFFVAAIWVLLVWLAWQSRPGCHVLW